MKAEWRERETEKTCLGRQVCQINEYSIEFVVVTFGIRFYFGFYKHLTEIKRNLLNQYLNIC